MPKKFLFIGIALITVAVFVLIALGIWLGSFIGGSSGTGPSPYSAVLLSSGDVYFGKLSWFPSPRLSKVWVMQKQIDQNNQQQLSVVQFEKSFWGPLDELYLNWKEVLWWARLRGDSQLVKAIENPSAIEQQQLAPPSSPDTFRGPSEQPPSPR